MFTSSAALSITLLLAAAASASDEPLGAQLRAEAGAPVLLVAADQGLIATTAEGRFTKRLVPDAIGPMVIDRSRELVWFVSRGALRVLDLRRAGGAPVVVVDGVNGDFQIRPPSGKALASSAEGVAFTLDWRSGEVTGTTPGKPAPDRQWLEAERKRAVVPDRARRTQLTINHEAEGKPRTVKFGKTGRTLAARGTSCGLVDPAKKAWAPLDQPALAAPALSDEWICSNRWSFDREGKAWVGAGGVCTLAGCRKLPQPGLAAWLDAGDELEVQPR